VSRVRVLRAQIVRDHRAARVPRSVLRCGRATSAEVGSRTSPFHRQNMAPSRDKIEPRHHRADDAGAVLGPVNALRFASTRPLAGPAGIDGASARHALATTRWWSPDDCSQRLFTTILTRTSRGRMVASSRQCRTALLRFRHNGIRSAHSADRPKGTVWSASLTTSQPVAGSPTAVDLHTVGCEFHGLSRRSVLRTTRRNQAAFTGA